MNARSGRSRPLQASIHPFLIVLFLVASEARGQTTSALLREGDVVGTSGTVSSINNPSVNHVGGFSVQMNTTTGTTTLSHIWGNASGGAGAILLTENTYGNWLQTAFESFNGLNDRGEACYGVTATNLSNGTTGLDGVFMDATPILIGREPVPTLPGFYSTFNSRPGCTSGEPYWVGGITNVPNSSTSQNRVLFFGFQADPVLKGGDNIGGINVPHVTGGMDFDVRFSRGGTHWVLDGQVTGPTANDRVMVLDGSALVAGGGFVREGLPIPAAVGGIAGENWANFDFMGVTELGRVFFTGDSSAATSVDEAVFDGGQIVLREGTVYAGPGGNYTISGDIEGGYQNRQGDWAVVWDATGANAVNREVLFVNGRMVLQETDAVDLSGDGVPEPTSKLADFTGISSLVIGPRDAAGNVTLYFTADVDTLGTPTSSDDTEALLRLTVPSGVTNQLPVAGCQDVTVPAGAGCVAEANVNDGSSDPDDDPLTRQQAPAGPYPVGTTDVILTVTDIQGGTDTCTAQVTVTTACDDGNACTVDSCNPEGGCSHEPLDCDDGNACTVDACEPTSEEGCYYTPVDGDDANACTLDSCDPESGVQHEPISCDDENECTTDSCDPASGCHNDPVLCEDDNACTMNGCDPASGCTFDPYNVDDGDACTVDSCDPLTGAHYEPLVCDDENACTIDGCDTTSGCTFTPADADDGNACTMDSCDPLTGAHYEPITCDDGNGCTADSCDPATGCVFDAVGAPEPNPKTVGYWKRLCQGPHSGDELVDADAACVAAQGATFAGLAAVDDLCAVLLQDGQGGTCEHTEIDLLSLALNTCHVRVCGANAIQSQYGGNATVGESYQEADGILSDPDRNQQSCLDAKGLLEEINTGRALHLDTNAFDKVVGGGVRVTWEVPYGMTPVKYNVWRRRAGSMDAFLKIGETTTPVFDDATPGSFEYDVTPVR